jgi:multisubunit Na+/H+ antiporter MnhG subunit
MAIRRFGLFIERLFEKHKLVRRVLVIWSAVIITLATYAIFKAPNEITAASATALATVTGILTVVIGFYQWDRKQDDGENK